MISIQGHLLSDGRIGPICEIRKSSILQTDCQTEWKKLCKRLYMSGRAWNPATNRSVVLVFRLVLAGTFLLSSFGKLVDIERYSIAPVLDFEILPDFLAYIFGSVLPFIELLCALGLLFGVLTRLSSVGIALMSFSFFVVKAILLWNGSNVACGCFGTVVTTLISVTVYMDPPIFMMSLIVALSPPASRHWVSLWKRLSSKRIRRNDRFDLVW
jgi:uncharacterized membrane protein YphA (DoxX/SURF4 family)